MSFVDEDTLSLAGLDAPDFLQFDDSFSSTSSSSLTAHCHSSCTTSTCMKDPCRRRQKSTPSPSVVTTGEVHPSSSSSRSINVFKPLPPVPKVSSFHLSVIWDLCSDPPPVLEVSPPILTRKPTLYDSSIHATDGNHVANAAVITEASESSRVIYVSTDPYSPWPSPIRRHLMSRSGGSFSHISRYSRPESRSGARAPDPPSHRTSLSTVGCNVPGVRRVRRFTRNVRLFTQRIYALKALLRRTHRRSPVIPPTPITSLPRRRTSARASRVSSIVSFTYSRSLRTSMSSALTNSLQRWLEARNQLMLEKTSDHASITISQYELRGSWLTDDWCGIQHCDVHSTPPQPLRKLVVDRPISISSESLSGKYVSVSLRAGEEASRRRRRNSDRTATWSDLGFDSDSVEYRED